MKDDRLFRYGYEEKLDQCCPFNSFSIIRAQGSVGDECLRLCAMPLKLGLRREKRGR